MIKDKLITIKDIGRNLSPIGYTFKSPVLKPSVFDMEKIGRFIFECKCTSIFEHYPDDTSYMVQLTPSNYTMPFLEIWADENPGIVFPYTNTVDVIKDVEPVAAFEELMNPPIVEDVPVETVNEDVQVEDVLPEETPVETVEDDITMAEDVIVDETPVETTEDVVQVEDVLPEETPVETVEEDKPVVAPVAAPIRRNNNKPVKR